MGGYLVGGGTDSGGVNGVWEYGGLEGGNDVEDSAEGVACRSPAT